MSQAPSARVLAAWRWLEQGFDLSFGAALNPLRRLGALAFLAFWLLAVTGIWLYAVLDTSVSGAYASVARLSSVPWSAGGVMRSLHRYATDAFVILTALHLLREAVHGRWRHFRRFSWLTGCVLPPLVAVSAVGGFWLNWDQLGQFSAVATAEWLDVLPLLAQPLARNFLVGASVSDRLFSLFVFVHLGVSLLLLFGLWFHIQRITRAAVFPPRALALGTLVTLLLLAIVYPVSSQGPADLAQVPPRLALDWVVLFVHPSMYATSAGFTWALSVGTLMTLLALPFLPSGPQAPVAVVDPANCNGCRRCFADCPYAAITMVEHPDAGHGRELARVDADLCASCGICAGACPSSTPFRSTRALVSGIDMPELPVDALRRQLQHGLGAIGVPRPIVVFGCMRGADLAHVAGPDVISLPLVCAGQLAPTFAEYALRDGAAGVLVASCQDGGCEFRLGAQWTAARLRAEREPRLRVGVPRERIELVHADRGEETRLLASLATLRERLRRIKSPLAARAKIEHG